MKKTVYKFRVTWKSNHGLGMTSRLVKIAAKTYYSACDIIEKLYPVHAGYTYEKEH